MTTTSAVVEEEADALEAIYGSEIQIIRHPAREYIVKVVDTPLCVLHVVLPDAYPGEMPTVDVDCQALALAPHSAEGLMAGLRDVWEDAAGEPCIFPMVEHARERLQDVFSGTVCQVEARLSPPEDENRAGGAEARRHSGDDDQAFHASCTADDGPPQAADFVFHPAYPKYGQRSRTFSARTGASDLAVEIVSGEPFVDRKSTFQAHLAVVHSRDQCDWVMRTLLQKSKIARATHNIMAFRFFDADRGVQCADNDEDGEDAAGARLAELLELMGANNIIVVVSRWFGGIKLGPDRFRHINNAARSLIEAQGLSDPGKRPAAGSGSRKSRRGRKDEKGGRR